MGVFDVPDDWGGAAADFLGGTGVFGRNLITDPFGDVQAAEAQRSAQQAALDQQKILAEQARQTFLEQSAIGREDLSRYGEMGQGAIAGGRDAASQYLAGAQGQALGAMGAGQQLAQGALAQGYGQGRGDIAGGFGMGRSDLAGGYGAARGAYGQLAGMGATDAYSVMGAQDRAGRMLDQPGGMYAGFESDPGYKFRQQQGEDAINRAASARGGRLSGRTLQELGEFNQGLASQEYGNFANRRQAEAGMASGSDAQRAALLTNQAGRTDQAQLAAQGYRAQGLGQLGAAGMQYGQAQAGLAAQGGQALGNMAYGYGSQQAGMHGQYGRDTAGLYSQYAGQQAQNAQQAASQSAQLYGQTGSNLANIAIGVGGNAQANANNLMGAYQNYAQTGGMVQQAQANQNRETAGMIASFFSDERLKEQIETVPGSRYELIGLRGARWKWNAKAGELLGLHGEDQGVIAQEVAEVYPHAVGERDGFMIVNYAELERMVGETAECQRRACAEIDALVSSGDSVGQMQVLANVARNPDAHPTVRMHAAYALIDAARRVSVAVLADLPAKKAIAAAAGVHPSWGASEFDDGLAQ